MITSKITLLYHCNLSEPIYVTELKNNYTHARHDKDWTVLSCLVWQCELSRPDSQTGAFCVCSVSECVRQRCATAGRTPTQNALVRGQFTPSHQTRQDRRACQSTATATQASYA